MISDATTLHDVCDVTLYQILLSCIGGAQLAYFWFITCSFQLLVCSTATKRAPKQAYPCML